jgi:hypothetical protein
LTDLAVIIQEAARAAQRYFVEVFEINHQLG